MIISENSHENTEKSANHWLFWAVFAAFSAFVFANSLVLMLNGLLNKYEVDIPVYLKTALGTSTPPFFMVAAVTGVAYLAGKRRAFAGVCRLRNWKFYYIPEGAGLQLVFFIPLTLISLTMMQIVSKLKQLYPGLVNILLKSSNAVQHFALNSDWPSFACFAFAAVVIAPIGEEIIFRGVLFSFFRRHAGNTWATVCSAFIFAGCHLNFVQFIPLFMLGVIFQQLYIRHKSIYPAMIYHSINNSVAVAVLFALKLGFKIT